MQLSDVAEQISAEKCLTYRGKIICSQEFSSMVSSMLQDEALSPDSTTALLAESNKQLLAENANAFYAEGGAT